jgi:hypothetical protein
MVVEKGFLNTTRSPTTARGHRALWYRRLPARLPSPGPAECGRFSVINLEARVDFIAMYTEQVLLLPAVFPTRALPQLTPPRPPPSGHARREGAPGLPRSPVEWAKLQKNPFLVLPALAFSPWHFPGDTGWPGGSRRPRHGRRVIGERGRLGGGGDVPRGSGPRRAIPGFAPSRAAPSPRLRPLISGGRAGPIASSGRQLPALLAPSAPPGQTKARAAGGRGRTGGRGARGARACRAAAAAAR